jgi:hypothetical protein
MGKYPLEGTKKQGFGAKFGGEVSFFPPLVFDM